MASEQDEAHRSAETLRRSWPVERSKPSRHRFRGDFRRYRAHPSRDAGRI